MAKKAVEDFIKEVGREKYERGGKFSCSLLAQRNVAGTPICEELREFLAHATPHVKEKMAEWPDRLKIRQFPEPRP